MSKKVIYSAFNEYILRTPLLSSKEVSELSVEEIKSLCKRSYVSEAIYIASPELHREMIKFTSDIPVKNESKLVSTLLKYLLRMGNRCTPFGLFSGFSVGRMGDQNRITLNGTSSHTRSTRLDMNYLCSLSQKLESDRGIRNALLYFPNNSLYKIGNKLRYVEFKYENTLRRHFTVGIDISYYITLILENSYHGSTINELAKLIDEPDVSLEEAKGFIHELIDNQILISSISPSVTGKDYLNTLKKNINDTNIKKTLQEVENILSEINSSFIGEGFKFYTKLYETVKSFNVKFNKKFLLQTDMITSTKVNTIDKKVEEQLRKAFVALNKLSNNPKNETLDKFKKEFYKRYEEEEIPLALALDIESGVGYPADPNNSYDIAPLIDDINFSDRKVDKNDESTEVNWNKKDSLLHAKLVEAYKTKSNEIEITDKDLETFDENWDNFPNTFSAIIRILGKNDDSVKIMIDSVGNTSATAFLGRFCHSNKNINELVDNIINTENSLSNKIIAEIAHLPEKRTGNVLFRPHLREFEIPYLAKSSLEPEKQIPINDLMVSIKNDKIVLRSKRLDKEIATSLATAHNYSNLSLPIYYFLCDLQEQGLNDSLTFDWGNITILMDYFPRVVYKGVILSPETWFILEKDIKKMISIEGVKSILQKLKIPTKFLIKDGDNELLININHDLSVETFISMIKNKQQIMLTEFSYDMEEPLVEHNGMPYTNELILSFYKN